MLLRQLALPLPAMPPSADAPFLGDPSNAEALGCLDRPADWPDRRLALHGPGAVGKSHLLRQTARRQGWPLLAGAALRGLAEPPPGPGLALDDADCVAEERSLLHLLNWCAEQRRPLLLSGRLPPARWPVRLPDLSSRLRGMLAIGIAAPSDDLLAALLRRHFQRRQLRVEPAVQDWLLLRLPRTAAAVAEAAARLDRAALAAGGAVTRGLAGAALGDLLGPEHDDCMAGPTDDCPGSARLL